MSSDETAFQQALQANPEAGQSELIALAPETDGLRAYLAELWQKFVQMFEDFLAPWFTNKKQVDIGPYIEFLFTALVFVLILALSFLVILFVVRTLRLGARKGSEASFLSPQKAFETDEESLEKRLESAVKDNDFALAARLRWKLFLLRSRLHQNVTPYEWLQSPVASSQAHLDFDRTRFIQTDYELMFSHSKNESDAYQWVADRLSEFEGRMREETLR